MKKQILIISIIIFLTLTIFWWNKYFKNLKIKEKISQTQELINENKNNIFVSSFGWNKYRIPRSYFKAWKNLKINSMSVDEKETDNLEIKRSKNYYKNTKNNDYLNQVWLDKFINKFSSWSLYLQIPTNWWTYFWVLQDYSIYKEDLKDYFEWNIEKLFKNKTQEYWELVNFNQDYQEYLDNYKNNFEKYYEINLEVNSNFSGTWEIYYYPYYDNHFYDWNNWFWGRLYENFVVDNAFYPYINLAEINNKNALISTIDKYEKYFDKSNYSEGEKIKNSYYKITYYNKKYVIKWNFKKWKNIIKINMFQSQTPKMWYTK